MKWETRKPDRIGTYWHADPHWNRGSVRLMEVFMTLDGELGANVTGSDHVFLLNEISDSGLWAKADMPESPCSRTH